MRVAFNGLGTMGSGMAARLLGAGFPVTVWNRNAERAVPLREKGAAVAESPADAARDADVVIAMLADDAASRGVWTSVLTTARKGAVLVECSTVSPQWVRELAELAAAHGCPLLDAPVTGSKPQAANGELLFLVGGDEAALERARPALAAMSRGIVHLGASGAGAAMKLINNFICGVQAASLAEAVAWIERCGLDQAQAVSILTGGAPASPIVKALAARMQDRTYETNFRVDLMAKDLAYAAAEAARTGLELKSAAAAEARFHEAADRGFAAADLSAVVEGMR